MKDAIGDRMKRYEAASDAFLSWRLPVVLRVDGRAFHRYTRGLKRPFDESFVDTMNGAAGLICAQLAGARMAYVQSDEISVLLFPWSNHASQPAFGNRIQKLCSVAASLAAAFVTSLSPKLFGEMRIASFDGRAFCVPPDDVTNYFLWRQLDASRNSVQMVARAKYSHKQCHGLNQKELIAKLETDGIHWNLLPEWQRRGRCVVRDENLGWVVDGNVPIWKGPGREYVERFVRQTHACLDGSGR